MLPRSPLALALLLGTSLLPPFAAAAPVWREQGPGPIYGGSNVATQPRNPEAGAIAAIALSPTDSSLIYVGAVNGGIWRSTDATASVPHWTPLTDRSLPALSIASLAISPANDRIIFAGTGSQSSLTNVGSNGFGIARSLDGGDTWSVIGGTTFAGQHVSAVVPTKLEGGSLLLAGSRRPAASDVKDPDAGAPPAADAATAAAGTVLKYGLYRTENAVSPDPDKVVFKMISGTGAGLPPGGVSAIAADPVHPGHFYTSISARDGGQAAAGVYYSHDGGATWARINGSGARQLTGLGNSSRILLSAYADAKTVAVYAAVIAADGTLSGVFRTVSQGQGWVSMGVPTPSIFPGNQGDLHGALVADPKNPNVVFIAGDTHDLPDPSGCKSYYGAIVRGDASKAGSQRWHSVVCDNAQGTAPHADSRAMAFTADGNLIEADDGGIYQLTAPNGASPKWSSLIGNIRPTEFHSIAYDPLSKVIFGGAQDNGVPMQGRQNGLAWEEFAGGDGGVVAVDADQTVHPGKTLRYTAYTNLQFLQRSTWDQSNNLLGTKEVALRIVAGTACQKTLAQCDGTAPFYTPMVLNKIDPRRMLIGTNSLYESPNGGDSLIYLGKLGDTVGGASPFGRPMVYGGKLNGKDYPGMFYVGSGARLFHRVVANGRIATLAAYKGDEIRTVAVNPFNYRQVFVLDAAGQLWGSLDEGAHFSSMTGNLRQLTPKMGTLTVYAPDGVASHAVIIAGGFGIFQAHVPAAGAEPTWTKLATGFPNVLVGDLQYDNASDTLVAGTLGRGAWSLSGFFTGTTAVANAEPTSEAMPKPFGNQKRALPSLELKSRTP